VVKRSRRHLDLAEEFPGTGHGFTKIEEGLPFMTWDEAERRIEAGDDPEKVWDCVYLRPSEITDWMKERGRGKTLFCKGDGKEITPREAMNYFDRAFRVSTWRVLRGLQVFRHSFCAALASKGVDQRIIDEVMGHSTEQQRRRYRHMFPDVTKTAMLSAFA